MFSANDKYLPRSHGTSELKGEKSNRTRSEHGYTVSRNKPSPFNPMKGCGCRINVGCLLKRKLIGNMMDCSTRAGNILSIGPRGCETIVAVARLQIPIIFADIITPRHAVSAVATSFVRFSGHPVSNCKPK